MSLDHESSRAPSVERQLDSDGFGSRPGAEVSSSLGHDEEEDLYLTLTDVDEAFDAGDLQAEGAGWEEDPASVETADLAGVIRGFYRILDLISERGSGGLVDKVVIAQDSIERFVNDIAPGAYVSMTKINFSSLDKLELQPIGIYGSKTEIVAFLRNKDAIDEESANMLLSSGSPHSQEASPQLRAGIYIFRPDAPGVVDTTYIIFWPEDTTWNDDAISSVQRNRVTFMRYLTKLASRIVALISRDHLDTILWKDGEEEEEFDSDNDDDSREYNFEVFKSEEQEEAVLVKSGFVMPHPIIGIDNNGLQAYLIPGESQVGVMELSRMAPVDRESPLREFMYSIRLARAVSSCSFVLDRTIPVEAVNVLLQHGLGRRAPMEEEEFNQSRTDAALTEKRMLSEKSRETMQQLDEDAEKLKSALHAWLATELERRFSLVTNALLSSDVSPSEEAQDYLGHLRALIPEVSEVLASLLDDQELKHIQSPKFAEYKRRILLVEALMSKSSVNNDDQAAVVSVFFGAEDHLPPMNTIHLPEDLASRLPWGKRYLESMVEARLATSRVSDHIFLLDAGQDDFLQDWRAKALTIAIASLRDVATRKAAHLATEIRSLEEREILNQIRRECRTRKESEVRLALKLFLDKTQSRFRHDRSSQLWIIQNVEAHARGHTRPDHYRVVGINRYQLPGRIRCTIHPLQLTAEDRQALRTSEDHVPSPRIHPRSSTSLRLDLDQEILHCQLLGGGLCLVAISDQTNDVRVYLEPLADINTSIYRQHSKKLLRHERIGHHPLIAFDETKRMLAFLPRSVDLRQLYFFVFDERFSLLQAQGSPIRVGEWYEDNVEILFIALVCGSTEEIVFVDSLARARVFSWVTQQFRPNSVQLLSTPQAVYSSPDGSCLLVLTSEGLHAYHWTTFGSAEGIAVALPDGNPHLSVLTSFGARGNLHFVVLDPENSRLQSTALTVTHKVTEFAFKEKHVAIASSSSAVTTCHNSLLECHSDVWTRFPVAPVLKRGTRSSVAPKMIIFVAPHSHSRFRAHFTYTIAMFKKRTRKPADEQLDRISVTSISIEAFVRDGLPLSQESTIPAGEWLVELLCLIPIHIALTHDNRFIPLKNGIWSADYERSLAGARVDQIVDSISFGWYESIFRSYMASKPVKVVSSMGEQSVGKSFALNHLVDTSFAGSAMRTTEGVWMSVNPTNDMLVVALDFEGVHSIERSAQEDALLVLFNTAISNLVLFRNNFAISRDIAGLFQSFQSSAMILDPAANPSLFCSKLVIIIKDVVQSDKEDIKKEFQLKFQQIVEMEQGLNFITRLHKNNLAIIPWPVIESKQFYTLFKRLKQNLDEQPVTHENAVIFLTTIKTLMAKLKANDWGSLSQNLAAHRVRYLLSLLPIALAFGVTENEPTFEALRDLDTGHTVESHGDTNHRFVISDIDQSMSPDERRHIMDVLRMTWDAVPERPEQPETVWCKGLARHLDGLLDRRILHVKSWITSNLSRFVDHPSTLEPLHREFDAMTGDMRASIRLCGMQCLHCHLTCILPNHHDASHDCTTSHHCPHLCSFADEHHVEEGCGLPAGHAGNHICNISAHLCGKICSLVDKHGCLERCAKSLDHKDEEHMCPASVHECSQPCSLQGIFTSDGHMYACSGTCRVPSHIPHEMHKCEVQACPLQCQLCKRTCITEEHLHGLDLNSAHLCGEQHMCPALCQSHGICQIETTPHSMDATFTGKHGAFQYTKYSQSAKRLPCVLAIPAGNVTHDGVHQHSAEPTTVHFCETRCENCGYYCVLPLGHQQLEHETSHGSMSRTRWAIGPDGNEGITVNGHKFGAGDEGAPMLCSLVCKSLGRHAHIDFCRGSCSASTDVHHISTTMGPEPARAKDWVTHNLHWRRTGFKDPYTQEERADFVKCDAMCSGVEHRETANAAARPSYCTQPLFHRPVVHPTGGIGYVSSDGHHFRCTNPAPTRQFFHVMFLIDKSQSMGMGDRQPLRDTPVTARLVENHNNRLGAVFSSLHSFWTARQATFTNTARGRDAYTVILFDENVTPSIINDSTSTPDALLAKLLPQRPQWRTNFQSCLDSARDRMRQTWSADRAPIVVLLSDGEANVPELKVRRFCEQAIDLGKALSFHAVSFGPHNDSLRQIVNIATQVQNSAPVNPAQPTVPCSYAEALDTVQLAQTFLGIAESLRKPRGSLIHA